MATDFRVIKYDGVSATVLAEDLLYATYDPAGDRILAVDMDGYLCEVDKTTGATTQLVSVQIFDGDVTMVRGIKALDGGYYVLASKDSKTGSAGRGEGDAEAQSKLLFYSADVGVVVGGTDDDDGSAVASDSEAGAVVDILSSDEAVIGPSDNGGVVQVNEDSTAVRLFYSRYPEKDQFELPKQAEKALVYYALSKCYAKETDEKYLAKAGSYANSYLSEVNKYMKRVAKKMRPKSVHY